jgi:L-cysteine:1D-myo-inositol 2-amino-2-deoxy-alpha-D-glucopyranoside ligase
MSKSRGNLVFVSKLRESGLDPALIRLALLAHHYRSDWEWNGKDLDRAAERLDRWRAALDNTNTAQAEQLVTTVRAALAQDLDTPRVVTLLDDWAEGWHRGDASASSALAVSQGMFPSWRIPHGATHGKFRFPMVPWETGVDWCQSSGCSRRLR